MSAWVARHPLAAFLVWSATVGQAVVLVPVLVRARYGVDLPTEPFVVASTLVGLLLPTLVITRLADGPEGLAALWARVVRVRVPLRWYLPVLAVPVVTTAATVAVAGAPEGGSSLAGAVGAGLVLQLVVGFVTVNWWEEVAWAGFVQARLEQRSGPLRAAVVAGVLFALQHTTLVLGGTVAATAAALVLLAAVAVPFRYLQGWLYARTQSLAVVGLVHAAGNATAAGSLAGAGLLPRLYAEEGAGGLVFPVLALGGLVVMAAALGGAARRRGGPATARSAGAAPASARAGGR